MTTDNVDIQVQQTVRLDITLEVGEVNQSIEVTANANRLQAENWTLGSVVGNTSIVELPLNGREYLNLEDRAQTNVVPSLGLRSGELLESIYGQPVPSLHLGRSARYL